MKNIIKEMIAQADDERNFDLIRWVKEILDEFAFTCNCPSDWRYIGAELARESALNSLGLVRPKTFAMASVMLVFRLFVTPLIPNKKLILWPAFSNSVASMEA